MSSTPNPSAKNGRICVEAALKTDPKTEQRPKPEATERATRKTPETAKNT